MSLTRGLIMCSAYLAFILSIAAMPMADSVAIYFPMPLIVAVLAGPMLGEHVRAASLDRHHRRFLRRDDHDQSGRRRASSRQRFSLFIPPSAMRSARPWRGASCATVPPTAMAFHTKTIYLLVAIILAVGLHRCSIWARVEHKSLAFLTRPWQ